MLLGEEEATDRAKWAEKEQKKGVKEGAVKGEGGRWRGLAAGMSPQALLEVPSGVNPSQIAWSIGRLRKLLLLPAFLVTNLHLHTC